MFQICSKLKLKKKVVMIKIYFKKVILTQSFSTLNLSVVLLVEREVVSESMDNTFSISSSTVYTMNVTSRFLKSKIYQ